MEISKIYSAVAELGVTPLMILPIDCYGKSFGGDRVKYKVVYIESPLKVIYGGSLPKSLFDIEGVSVRLSRYADFVHHCLKGTQGYTEMLFMPTPAKVGYWQNLQDHRETLMSSRQTLEEAMLYIDHGLMKNKGIICRHVLRKTEALLQFWDRGDIDFSTLTDCLADEECLPAMLNQHRKRLKDLLHLSQELDTRQFTHLILSPYRDIFQDVTC